MDKALAPLAVQVDPLPCADAEELSELAVQLGDLLLNLDVEQVAFAEEGEPPRPLKLSKPRTEGLASALVLLPLVWAGKGVLAHPLPTPHRHAAFRPRWGCMKLVLWRWRCR